MEPEKVRESLREFVATMETLLEIVPGASPQELLDYARGVADSPVAASVLCAAINALSQEVAPAPVPRKAVFGGRR